MESLQYAAQNYTKIITIIYSIRAETLGIEENIFYDHNFQKYVLLKQNRLPDLSTAEIPIFIFV